MLCCHSHCTRASTFDGAKSWTHSLDYSSKHDQTQKPRNPPSTDRVRKPELQKSRNPPDRKLRVSTLLDSSLTEPELPNSRNLEIHRPDPSPILTHSGSGARLQMRSKLSTIVYLRAFVLLCTTQARNVDTFNLPVINHRKRVVVGGGRDRSGKRRMFSLFLHSEPFRVVRRCVCQGPSTSYVQGARSHP